MKTISTAELKNLVDQKTKFTLVNTLKAEDFEKTKIADAVSVPLDTADFVARVEKAAGGKASKVVVYCSSSKCDASEKGAKKLMDAGFTDVARYTDGVEAWEKEVGQIAAGASS